MWFALVHAGVDNKDERSRHGLAAATFAAHRRRVAAPVLGFAPSGWRNVPSPAETCRLESGGDEFAIDYRLRGRLVDATINGDTVNARIVDAGPDSIVVETDGVARRYRIESAFDRRTGVTRHFVNTTTTQTTIVEPPAFVTTAAAAAAGGPTAPLPGTIVALAVAAGDNARSATRTSRR